MRIYSLLKQAFRDSLSGNAHVDSAQLGGILGVGLGVKNHLLAFQQGLEAVGDNGGKVYEHVAAAVVVGNKAEALALVKPFYCTVIHKRIPPYYTSTVFICL